jgi:hypothetical protein
MSRIKGFVACAALIAGMVGSVDAADTQGVVSSVVTMPVANGKHVVRIYFSSYTQDRWLCLQNTGYVEASDASAYLDAKGLDRLVALALTAMSSDMILGIDSSGANPCSEGVMFYLIK